MTPNPHANPIPNILTGLRLIAGVIMFLILAGAAPQGLPFLPPDFLSPSDQFRFARTAFVIFIVAASTDWVDGFLARRWHATTRWGAILGVLAWGSVPQAAIPCGLILFREFAVSALRETVAGQVKLPVTLLAKWKTVLQMVALAALQLALAPLWDGFGLPLEWLPHFQTFAYALLWVAALVTLWTGWQYFAKARQKMSQI